jgi:hypothetical protein
MSLLVVSVAIAVIKLISGINNKCTIVIILSDNSKKMSFGFLSGGL